MHIDKIVCNVAVEVVNLNKAQSKPDAPEFHPDIVSAMSACKTAKCCALK